MRTNWTIFTVLLSFVLSTIFTGLQSLNVAKTPTPTPTVTPTPTRTMPTNLLAGLKSQLFLGIGGGGPPAGANCWDAVDRYHGSLPAILLGQNDGLDILGSSEIWILCIVGMPVTDTFQVFVTGPNDKKLSNSIFQKGQAFPDGTASIRQTAPHPNDYSGNFSIYRSKPLIELNIWLPPDAPAGSWRIQAMTRTSKASGEITVRWPPNIPALFPATRNFDPFDTNHYNGADHWKPRQVLSPGKKFSVIGINFPPNNSIPITLYRLTVNAELTASAVVKSDPNGRLRVDVTMDSKDPPGVTLLIAVTDTRANDIYGAGPKLDLYSNSCPGAASSFLMVGNKVRLAYGTDFVPNNIRSQPGTRAPVTGKFGMGDTATIVDGFVCADRMVWWKIRTSTGLEGWTSEGQGDHIFLELDQ